MASVGCCRRRMYIQDCKTYISYNVLYVPYLYRLHVGIAASVGLGIRGANISMSEIMLELILNNCQLLTNRKNNVTDVNYH